MLRLYLKVAVFQPELQEYGPRTTLRFSSRSCGGVLRVLRLYLKVAIFQPELREHAPHTTSVLKSCDFPAPELQEHAPRTTFVLKSCDFQAGAAADQGGIEPATAGLRKQARKPRDNFQRPFREQEYCTAPQRERFDAHDLRRGSCAHRRNRKKPSVLNLDHANLRRGSRAARRNRKKFSVFEPAEGRARPAEIVKSPHFFDLDHTNLRRGPHARRRNRKKSAVF